MSDSQITNEVNQQFLRRTPVKLRQFSRLLNEMLAQNIEALRVKALFSQVNKTREACLAQNFESTAKLLNQLLKQLSLSEDSLETQKPLLKRLSLKLQEHSEKLELGVRPEKMPIAAKAPVPSEVDELPIDLADEEVLEDESDDSDTDDELAAQDIYLEKSTIILVSQSGQRYQTLQQQFVSLGVDAHAVTSLEAANQLAAENFGSVIVAPLKLAESNEQLADNEIETLRTPLIYTADEDCQESRLLGLRSGGTGFMVEPISLSSLLEHIERQYDIHADSPYRVLVMEDSKAQARYYEKALSKGHFEIRVVSDPTVLLEALRGFEPEVVLMDMQMPTCSGIELTRVIRQMPRYAYLPIIFLSAEENPIKQKQALLSGGTSFIVKPVEKEHLMFMAELYSRRFRDLNPHIGTNPDTGLPYSAEFKQQIAIEAARVSRSSGPTALAVIQLDQLAALIKGASFSLINVAIQQLTLILKKRLRKTDIIGHLDTGQLGIILTTGAKSDWHAIMDDIRHQFAELPFLNHHHDETLSVSIGLGLLSTNWDAHKWFAAAQSALTKALEAGGDQTQEEDSASS